MEANRLGHTLYLFNKLLRICYACSVGSCTRGGRFIHVSLSSCLIQLAHLAQGSVQISIWSGLHAGVVSVWQALVLLHTSHISAYQQWDTHGFIVQESSWWFMGNTKAVFCFRVILKKGKWTQTARRHWKEEWFSTKPTLNSINYKRMEIQPDFSWSFSREKYNFESSKRILNKHTGSKLE